MKQTSFVEFEDFDYLTLPRTKIQHIRFDYNDYGLTLFSVLSPNRDILRYSFSVFNPKDKQFIKSIGREKAIQRFKDNDVSFIDLTGTPSELFSSRYLTYLMLQQILFKSAIKTVNNDYPFTTYPKEFISSLAVNLSSYISRLYVHHNGKVAGLVPYFY